MSLKRKTLPLTQAVITCCLIICCVDNRNKMTELQHNLALLEEKRSSQITKIEHTQELHRKVHYILETDVEYLTRSVDELRYLVKITEEKQHHFKEISTKHSHDLHNLYRIHTKHQQTCVNTAKAELKHQFDVERQKIFEGSFEQIVQSVNEALKLYSHRCDGAKSVECKSRDQQVPELRATIRFIRQLFTELKMSVQRWMMTSRSALSSLQGLVYRHVTSEIMGVKSWTVGHIQRKLIHNAKPFDNLKGHVDKNTAKILVLNNTMKRFSCSFPNLTPTYKPRHAIRSITTRTPTEETTYNSKNPTSPEETTYNSKSTRTPTEETTYNSKITITPPEETTDYSETKRTHKEGTTDYSETKRAHKEGTTDYSETTRQKEVADYRTDTSLGSLFTLLLLTSLACIFMCFLWLKYSRVTKTIGSKEKQDNSSKKFKASQAKPTSKNKLEHSLCLVGFDSGIDQQQYVQMASDLVDPKCTLQIKRVLVQSTENLHTIPPSKVFIMFVDYNEKNLIIEEEAEGLRRKTLSLLQSAGAEVTVVYYWELSSKRLDSGQLYAQKLTTIDKMKELRELREKEAIFSIYDKFNQTQKDVFRSKLREFG